MDFSKTPKLSTKLELQSSLRAYRDLLCTEVILQPAPLMDGLMNNPHAMVRYLKHYFFTENDRQ